MATVSDWREPSAIQRFGDGRGGKHRDTPAARWWRETTKLIAANIRTAHPRMYAGIDMMHAEDTLAHVVSLVNIRQSGGASLTDIYRQAGCSE